MRRRLILCATLAATVLAGCMGAPDHTTLTQAQLLRALQERMPRSYPLAGLLELQLSNPRLALVPERNRLRVQFDLQASGPLLRSAREGLLDMEFGLRWQAQDQSLRAQDVQVHQLQLQGLPQALAALLASQGGALAEYALQDVALYRLQGQALERAQRLGVQPGAVTVTDEGLRVQLVPRP